MVAPVSQVVLEVFVMLPVANLHAMLLDQQAINFMITKMLTGALHKQELGRCTFCTQHNWLPE